MNLDVISDILVQAGLGTLGVDIFQQHMPDACSQGILLKLPLSGIEINHYVPGYYRAGKVQTIVRSGSAEAGDALAARLQKALTITARTDYIDEGGQLAMTINHLLPSTLPIIYPRSPGNLSEWSINFEGNYVMPA